MFGCIANQIPAEAHIQRKNTGIQVLRNYRYNSLTHAEGRPKLEEKIWF